MRFGSLFAGIGGFDLGLERAGMSCAWQVELDPFCNRVLAKHWPDVPRYSDVRECTGLVADDPGDRRGKRRPGGFDSGREGQPERALLAPVDLICGGFPCQPFSQAGKQLGTEDDRDLWPEMARLIEELRPAWVLGENVTGFVKMALDRTLSNLEALGYACRAFVVPACAVAAPHQRSRVWIIGYADQHGQSALPVDAEVGVVSESMAHAERLRKGQSAGYSHGEGQPLCQTERQESASRARSGGETLADASSQGRDTEGSASETLPGPETQQRLARCDSGKWQQGQPECGLGGMADRPARWLDEPDGIPRVITGQPDRVNRLKALGNAVVPQVVEEIGRMIVEAQGE